MRKLLQAINLFLYEKSVNIINEKNLTTPKRKLFPVHFEFHQLKERPISWRFCLFQLKVTN